MELGAGIEDLESAWLDCPAYLLGVDLFNLRFYWESHEAWEEVWNAVGHRSLSGRMIQGMIQVAASLLKQHMGSVPGAEGNFRKACRHFDFVESELSQRKPPATRFLGVRLPDWRLEVAAYLDDRSRRHPYLELYAE